jgi:hypothetical protein
MATTVGGTPYVVGSDPITSYPTTSLALANRVDALESSMAGLIVSPLMLIGA